MVQRRKAAAKVVQSHTHLAVGKALQQANRGIGSLVESALGNFEYEARWIGATGREGSHHLGHQISVEKLPARQVDRHKQILLRQLIAPGTQLRAYDFERLAAQRNRKAGILRHCEQAVDILDASIGAAQAEQGFESFEIAVREPVDGLIAEAE